MDKPIRILQITGGMDMGGIENFIMNIYRNIDRTKVQFDFLIHQEKKQIFEDEILSLGGKIYRISSFGKVGHFGYLKALHKFFIEHLEYKIVHSHYNAVSGIILKEAKKCKVKKTISHSHIAYPKYRFFEKIYKNYSKSFIKKNADIKFACSKLAGEWLYKKNSNFKVINNGIEPLKYKYNLDKRIEKRKELVLDKRDIVVGHVGRLDKQKNHKFLIEIFSELVKINNNYKLILIGTGELEKEIKEQIKNLNLEDNVRLLGVRKDVNKLLQAFDIFLFPSLYEGLPVTLVEAQGAGLKCFISDSVTKEIDLECGLTEFISLEKSPKEWAEIVDKNREYERKDTVEALRSHGYDMTQNAKELENLYIKLYENN